MPSRNKRKPVRIFHKPNFFPGKQHLSKRIILLLTIILVLIIIYLFKSLFIVAVVNGKPITRVSLIKELEKQAGKQTLEALITKNLIIQEAKKQKISVTPTEVENEVNTIKETLKQQGQELEQILSLRGMTMLELKAQIELQKLVEKLAAKDISVSDEEVNTYISQNKDLLATQTGSSSGSADIKALVKKQLEDQKITEKIQTWVQNLQKDAKINYWLKL